MIQLFLRRLALHRILLAVCLFFTLEAPAQWRDIGPSGGTFSRVFADEESYYLFGNKSVFQSQDGGTTWQTLTTGLTNSQGFIDAYFSNGSLFAQQLIGRFWAWEDAWISLPELTPFLNFPDLASVEDVLYLYSGTGSFYSLAEGSEAWQDLGIIRGSDFTLGLDPGASLVASSEEILLGTTRGIFSSLDGGSSWARVDTITTDQRSLVILGDQWFSSSPQGLYIGTLGSTDAPVFLKDWPPGQIPNQIISTHDYLINISTSNQLWLSDDQARTWQALASPPFGDIEDIAFLDDQRGIVITENGSYETSDRGTTWQPLGFDKSSYAAFAFRDFGDFWVVNTNHRGPIYSEDQGITWSLIGQNSTVVGTSISEGSKFISLGDQLFYDVDGSSYRLRKVDSTWEQLVLPTGIGTGFTFTDFQGNLIAADYENVIWFSSDGGTTWEQRSNPDAGSDLPVFFVPIMNSSSEEIAYRNTFGDVFISEDAGQTWTERPVVDEFNTPQIVSGFYHNEGQWYANTRTDLWVLADGSDGWEKLTTSPLESSGSAQLMRSFIVDQDTIWAAVECVLPGAGGQLTNCLYVKTTPAANWKLVPTNGSENGFLYTLASVGNELFMGTGQAGLQAYPKAELGDITQLALKDQPAPFQLYPNPAPTGDITLKVDDSQGKPNLIRVMDLAGRQISTEIQQSSSTTYQLQLHQPGLYLVTFSVASGKSWTQKLVVR
ncbi:MAG TPA: hypothetical protein DCE41_12165 [Cytophagales bacterium]|nr:hypothetical protein [Cytophagales bacterium]HAA21731.1 hypothetical protein [Cytophagales bacterium]HAP62211.1 hypothetical protein [Cytophagales bacterium]